MEKGGEGERTQEREESFHLLRVAASAFASIVGTVCVATRVIVRGARVTSKISSKLHCLLLH